MANKKVDPDFPCSLIIRTPFPTHRLASSALKALQVDAELSPLVRRSFSLVSSSSASSTTQNGASNSTSTSTSSQNGANGSSSSSSSSSSKTILVTEYKAKTNRMLRVSVNGFMESLGVVLGVMEKLDVDVLPSSGGGVAPPPAKETVAATN